MCRNVARSSPIVGSRGEWAGCPDASTYSTLKADVSEQPRENEHTVGQPATSASLDQPASAAAPASTYTVLYEDEDLLAVDKRAGSVIHPAYRHPSGTLFDAIAQRQAARGESRPCLLHRLDRDTSGVVLFAKSERARRTLVRQFELRQVRKWYLALALGRFDAQHG